MAIQIRSYNQILGDMIRTIIARTPLNDVNTGSVLLTLLEACAANDFENNVAILNVLELLNIDALRNNDLDARGSAYKLPREAARKASGNVSFLNTNITKQSTGLYIIKPAPVSSQTTLYVNNTAGWADTGALYIGRGTTSFEGPIPYTAITRYVTYSKIDLGSALQKDHLSSDIVVNAQGQPDYVISAGTSVKIPANNQNPEIKYLTLRDAVIPAGEDRVDNVPVIAFVPGSQGNALINTITQFDSVPFDGAAVINTSSFSNGRDVETDTSYRNRIKSYADTLARGTAPAIQTAVLGLSDPDENKQVVSARLSEAVSVGEPSILYVDDGSGFQPTYDGQSVDVLLLNATGKEQFLQLANFPLPRPQVVNAVEGPFILSDSMFLRVAVDGIEDTVIFTEADFVNITAATAAEIVVAINDKSTIFKARLTNNSTNILLYPVDHDAEEIQVIPLKDSDVEGLYANHVLKFPVEIFSYIALYQNSDRLHQKEKTATLETVPYASWNILSAGNIVISVDSTPSQNVSFSLNDFAGASSFATLTLQDWVNAFNMKCAGITANATPSQTMQISSNKVGSGSSLALNGGSYLSQIFADLDRNSEGQASQFEINRATGNIKMLTTINPGDTITAGIADAKGFVLSAQTLSGNYNVSTDSFGRPAEMVIVADSTYCNKISVGLQVGLDITVSDEGSSVMRVMSSSLNSFKALMPGHYIYIAPRASGWLSSNNTGLFKVITKGNHLSAGVDSYVEVINNNITNETTAVSEASDIKAFATDAYPQVWRGTYTSNPPVTSLVDMVDSINDAILGVRASIFRSNYIKISSITENGGSIAVPVSIGNLSTIFMETASCQSGNPSSVANRVSDKELLGLLKTSIPTNSNVWLDRYTSAPLIDGLTSESTPDEPPYSDPYSEILTSTNLLTDDNVDVADSVAIIGGNNQLLIRSIAAKTSSTSVGTQQGTARTELDHAINDQAALIQSMRFAADDSVVFIADKDASAKTVDIKMARNIQCNSGSGAGSFVPTSTEFSANDLDNEPGIDFNNLNIWGKTINNTDFADYAVLMRARNWYSSGGVTGSNGKFLVRATEYGANGNSLQFCLDYPTLPDQKQTTTFANAPTKHKFTYFFGSGPARSILLPSGVTLSVKGPYANSSVNFPNGALSVSGEYYDYTFSAGSFDTVQVNDILSILSASGISTMNRGQFGIKNISGTTVRIFNPIASPTSLGAPTVNTITTVADVVGTPSNITIGVTAAAALDGTYFILHDNAGSVKVWFDVDNSGTAEPVSAAVDRKMRIATLLNTDTAADVASKIAAYLQNDNAFANVFSTPTQVIFDLAQNGPVSSPIDGTPPTSFSFSIIAGTADVSLNGKYFKIYDENGAVAVWFDIGDRGTLEPFHGANRSIRITNCNIGDTANTVAAAIAAAVNGDLSFSASATLNQVTITTAFNAATSAATAETSNFTVATVAGSLPASQTIVNLGQVNIFPLTGNDVATIVEEINAEEVLSAAALGNDALLVNVATKEEQYTYTGNSSALSFGHDPANTSSRNEINLYDGAAYVKIFSNSNPNFTLKTALSLNGVAPSVYSMDTAPNEDSTSGEKMKLIPTTVKNVHHHFTQKALSQLPIISDVYVSNSGKNVQIKSKQLGSDGAVEIVGGQANRSVLNVIGESEIASDLSGNHLLCKIPAFPNVFSVGDIVKLENTVGTKRLSRLQSSDTISVSNPFGSSIEYSYNPKVVNFSPTTEITITDVSALYGRPAGFVWRWTHDGIGGATLSSVVAGDLLMAFGDLSGWDQGNKVRESGDESVAGLPIINVNDALNWVDVVNPYGVAMSATAIGANSVVQICPTPIIKWNLNHSARVPILSISRMSNVVTFICDGPHMLNTGDNVEILDSDIITDGIYGPVTVLSLSQFAVTIVGSDISESAVGASVLKTTRTPTKYRLETLGMNGIVRLICVDGDSPRFIDCGVAVDDFIKLKGQTFSTNNNGIYRVIAVNNNSVIFINKNATEQVNTLFSFNNKDLLPTWIANSNIVTGAAGTFKNLSLGDWVKKAEDNDNMYVQVTAFTPSSPELATSITLGSNYTGTSTAESGVAYNQKLGYRAGVTLKTLEDIQFFEGDSTISGDTLYIQDIVDLNWFDINNTGRFDIAAVGTHAATHVPFLRVSNDAGQAESNVALGSNYSSFYVIESDTYKFKTYRTVYSSAIDDLNDSRRAIYLSPPSRQYKFSEANTTQISSTSKLGYNTDVTTGIDGYLYYTGLLRRVQRVVDGFEPDPTNYPGRRAVGGFIEILPPLIRDIIISLSVTTGEGFNVGDISNNIKSSVINYIEGLGVGEDVILSEIIAEVMKIKGVVAVTFNNPTPSTERIVIADNEKATISPSNISIA